ncbi:MAG: prolyl oligopeptidase family serine peptidase, partial [Prolixibacteraceae bacterium]|nr:prolyl oligopeptidase family serine peptidase [Prolixibacteraceae bacterium]
NKQSETEIILAQRFAQLGYVAASMNYRMGFRLKGYDVERTGYKSVQDVHAALRYLAHNAEKYGIDPSHVYVAGTSAGAIASLTIAYFDNNERPKSTFATRFLYDLGNVETSGNKYNEEFTIKAVGNMWGAVNDTAIINAGQNVPVISFHGTNDDIVPIDHDFPFRFMMRFNRLVMNKMYGSRPVHEQLNRLNIDNELHIFENEGHEPQLDNFKRVNDKLDFIATKMESFFFKYTAPQIKTFKSNFTVNKLSLIEAVHYEVNNGNVSLIEVSGGIQVTNEKTENRIIWFSDTEKGKLTIHAKNRFGATTQKTIAVSIEKVE